MCICNPEDKRQFCGNKDKNCFAKQKKVDGQMTHLPLSKKTGNIQPGSIPWDKIKAEFILSDLPLKDVLARHGIKGCGNTRRMTEGWVDARAEHIYEITEKARKEAVIKGVEALARIDNDLFKIAPHLVPHLATYLLSKKKKGLTPMEVKTVLDMILVRTGQPTTVTKSKFSDDSEGDDLDDYIAGFSNANVPSDDVGEPEPVSYAEPKQS